MAHLACGTHCRYQSAKRPAEVIGNAGSATHSIAAGEEADDATDGGKSAAAE